MGGKKTCHIILFPFVLFCCCNCRMNCDVPRILVSQKSLIVQKLKEFMSIMFCRIYKRHRSMRMKETQRRSKQWGDHMHTAKGEYDQLRVQNDEKKDKNNAFHTHTHFTTHWTHEKERGDFIGRKKNLFLIPCRINKKKCAILNNGFSMHMQLQSVVCNQYNAF